MYEQLIRNQRFSLMIKKMAKKENISHVDLTKRIQDGTCVITCNNRKILKIPCAIGKGLTTKVNVNVGTSTDKNSLRNELKKVELSVELGADTIMDLSLGGDLALIRKTIIDSSPIPVGTVPIYEAAMRAQRRKGSFLKMEKEEILDILREQAACGVDFFTIHSGINKKSLAVFLKNKRLLNVVSRGGALIVNWMRKNNRENPFYQYFDDILKIAKEYNITLSLGDGMRPGSILDATDASQIAELKELGKLTSRCRENGVQVIIEGPGHVPLHHIKKNMDLQKKICKNAPFYVLGPLVTDVAIGYDHISGAIGGALAAFYGADFLCYLTPAEHVRHPSIEDARNGLIASKIAAHAADIAKGLEGSTDWDRKLSLARKNRNWAQQIKLAIDPRKARDYRKSSHPKIKDVCTMCGEFCSIRLIDKCLDDE